MKKCWRPAAADPRNLAEISRYAETMGEVFLELAVPVAVAVHDPGHRSTQKLGQLVV